MFSGSIKTDFFKYIKKIIYTHCNESVKLVFEFGILYIFFCKSL